MKELGLEDFFIERLAITGDERTFGRRLEQYEEIGIDAMLFSGFVPDKLGFISRLGRAA